jgi:hypothetical protein
VEDRYFYLETPDFMTCFEEYREDLFHSSKLKLSEKGESPKEKKSGVSSEVLRRNAETDLQRMYRERLEKEEVEEEEEY